MTLFCVHPNVTAHSLASEFVIVVTPFIRFFFYQALQVVRLFHSRHTTVVHHSVVPQLLRLRHEQFVVIAFRLRVRLIIIKYTIINNNYSPVLSASLIVCINSNVDN
jgi:hypothetical protein